MPTFLVLGVAKAGTTSLYQYLKQHPQIYMSPRKEPHFFAFGEAPLPTFTGPGTANVDQRVVSTLAAYQALFADWRDEPAGGEVATSNFTPRACARIHQYIPDARMILILRQPVERAYSQFLHGWRVGWEPMDDFVQALAAEPMRVQQSWLPALCHTLPSFYAPTLQHFFTRFPREQLRIYLYEEWQTRPRQVLQDIFGFIGVDHGFVPDMSVRHNTAAIPRSRGLVHFLRQPHALKRWLKPLVPSAMRRQVIQSLSTYNRNEPPRLDPQLRAELTETYREDILQVQTLIDRDLSHWLADAHSSEVKSDEIVA